MLQRQPRAFAAAALASLLTASPAIARERLLQPAGEWRLERAPEYCMLLRSFRDAAGKTVRLEVVSFGVPDRLRIGMIGNGLPLGSGQRGIAVFQFRFKPDAGWRRALGTTGYWEGTDALTFTTDLASSDEVKRRTRRRDMPAEPRLEFDLARAAAVDQIAIAYPQRDDTVLMLGSMSQPISDLRDCARQIVRGWGYDPALLATLESRPRLLNGKEIGGSLRKAMMRMNLGTNDAINIRIDVDGHGKAARCVVQNPHHDRSVDGLACDMMSDIGQFEPARDAGGNPVAAPLVFMVTFSLEGMQSHD